MAAPTAGLHFTQALFATLERQGHRRATVTLDVGPGTFLPVREEDLDKHHMHPERYLVPEATARAVNAAPAREGRRVVAVGTTVVRTLESATDPETGRLRAGPGETTLFIRPGFRFRQVDVLLTNFHLPRSTLVVLVSALLGRERTLAAYRGGGARGLPVLPLRRRHAGDGVSAMRARATRRRATRGWHRGWCASSCSTRTRGTRARRGRLHTPARPHRDAHLHAGGHRGQRQGRGPG